MGDKGRLKHSPTYLLNDALFLLRTQHLEPVYITRMHGSHDRIKLAQATLGMPL